MKFEDIKVGMFIRNPRSQGGSSLVTDKLDSTLVTLSRGGAVNVTTRYVTWEQADGSDWADSRIKDNIDLFRRDVDSHLKRIDVLKEEMKKREAERKGRVPLGYDLSKRSMYCLVTSAGDVNFLSPDFINPANVEMGNVYFDPKSAEQAIRDRKAAVKQQNSD